MSKFVTNAALNAARGESTAYDPQDRLNLAVDEVVNSRVQLARVGGNLNQVARALNAGGYPEPAELVRVIAAVARAITRLEECAAALVRV
ncbi:ABC-type transporter Mla subunit MlaD [Streptacidiphilus sp. MAP5-52]